MKYVGKNADPIADNENGNHGVSNGCTNMPNYDAFEDANMAHPDPFDIPYNEGFQGEKCMAFVEIHLYKTFPEAKSGCRMKTIPKTPIVLLKDGLGKDGLGVVLMGMYRQPPGEERREDYAFD
jgi:hypothetical protein